MDLYDILTVALVALLPGIEARGAIPLSYAIGLPPILGLTLSYVMSSLPSIPIIYLLEYVEINVIQRFSPLSQLYYRIVESARKRALRISQYKIVYVGLALYVAIPLPLTGVWTGSLIAYLLGLEPKKSIVAVFAGNLVASILIFLIVSGIARLI